MRKARPAGRAFVRTIEKSSASPFSPPMMPGVKMGHGVMRGTVRYGDLRERHKTTKTHLK